MTVAPSSLRHAPRRTTALLVAAVVLLAAALVAVLVHRGGTTSSSSVGSGVPASQTRELPSFTALDLAGANVVNVTPGAKQSVVVHADSNLLDRVTTRVENGTLLIGTRGSVDSRSPMSVDVSVPALSTVTLSGSGVITATGVDAPRLTLSLPGSGVLRVSGTVGRLAVTLDGSGDAQLDALTAREADAAIRGSGRIVVHATERLGASVSGSGAIVYTGSPAHLTRTVSGSGAIIGG